MVCQAFEITVYVSVWKHISVIMPQGRIPCHIRCVENKVIPVLNKELSEGKLDF